MDTTLIYGYYTHIWLIHSTHIWLIHSPQYTFLMTMVRSVGARQLCAKALHCRAAPDGRFGGSNVAQMWL